MTTTATPPMTSRGTATRTGLAWALGSAAAFGLSGPLAASLLATGWSPVAVVGVRIGGAFLVLLIPCLFLLRKVGLPSGVQTRRMVAYGVIAIASAQLCYFSAVQHLSVGVALLLEYLAPVLLIGWHWARSRTRPATTVFVGAVVAMLGMVFVLDLAGDVRLDPIGVAWGLGAALSLCGYFILAEDASSGPSIPPLVMTTAGTGVGALVIFAVGATGVLPFATATAPATIAGNAWPWWVPLALLVGVTAVLAYLTGIVAVRRLGSSVASFVALSEVLFAVTFAIILVGQQPSVSQIVGSALVLVGIATVQRPPRSVTV